MYDGCTYCPVRAYCDGDPDGERCDELITRMIENGRIDYYKEWFKYVGDEAVFS